MATMSDEQEPAEQRERVRPWCSPSVPMTAAETNEPIMNTSPWAKLISSTMP